MVALVQLAGEINMEVVAEGVETDAQHRLLQELGCDLGQGYYYAKPMSQSQWLDKFASQLQAWHARHHKL